MSSPTLSTHHDAIETESKMKKVRRMTKNWRRFDKGFVWGSGLYSFHKVIETNNVQWYTIPCVNSKYEFTLNTN